MKPDQSKELERPLRMLYSYTKRELWKELRDAKKIIQSLKDEKEKLQKYWENRHIKALNEKDKLIEHSKQGWEKSESQIKELTLNSYDPHEDADTIEIIQYDEKGEKVAHSTITNIKS